MDHLYRETIVIKVPLVFSVTVTILVTLIILLYPHATYLQICLITKSFFKELRVFFRTLQVIEDYIFQQRGHIRILKKDQWIKNLEMKYLARMGNTHATLGEDVTEELELNTGITNHSVY